MRRCQRLHHQENRSLDGVLLLGHRFRGRAAVHRFREPEDDVFGVARVSECAKRIASITGKRPSRRQTRCGADRLRRSSYAAALSILLRGAASRPDRNPDKPLTSPDSQAASGTAQGVDPRVSSGKPCCSSSASPNEARTRQGHKAAGVPTAFPCRPLERHTKELSCGLVMPSPPLPSAPC